jgi:anti-sigma regulatory factor (Ser/Thr protein kinase)/ActR/RegA family two-component response regulator
VPPKSALLIGAADDIRQELPRILRPPEWVIRQVSSNAEALELARSHPLDIVITSPDTPPYADIQLLRCIRRLNPHTRVIIITDEGTPADVLHALREGAFSYFCAPFSAAELADAVWAAMETPPWDDGIEIVSASPDWVRLIVRCDLYSGERVLRFVREMIDLPIDEREMVASTLRELLMNAMEHGGKFNPQQFLELSYIRTKRAVACRVKDPGQGFSFDEIHHAAVSNPLDDPLRHINYRIASGLRPGGFGILLSRNMVDELIYNNKGNEVLLIKYIDHQHPSLRG